METDKVIKLLKNLKVSELKEYLEKRELISTGNKKDLVERLEQALINEGRIPETYDFDLEDQRKEDNGSDNGFSDPEKNVDAHGSEIGGEGKVDEGAGGEVPRRDGDNRDDQMRQMFDLLMKLDGKAEEQKEVIKKLAEEQKEEINRMGRKIEERVDGLEKKIDQEIEEIRESHKNLETEVGKQKERLDKLQENIQQEVQKNVVKNLKEIHVKIERETKKDVQSITRGLQQNTRDIKDLEEGLKMGLENNRLEMENENLRTKKELEKNIKDLKNLQDENMILMNKNVVENKEELEERISKIVQEFNKISNDTNNRNFEVRKNLLQPEENKIKELQEEMMEEIQNLKMQIRVRSTFNEYPTIIDDSIRYEGNNKKIHPKAFIRILKNKVRGYTNFEDISEIVRKSLGGQPQLWYNSKEGEFKDFKDFEREFLKMYWGEIVQGEVRERIYFGKYQENRGNTMHNYALQLYSQAQNLEPEIKEGEIVMFLSRHFKSQIAETIAIQNIKSFEQLTTYLMRVERNLTKSNNNNTQGNNTSFGQNYSGNRRTSYNQLINNNNSRQNYNMATQNRNLSNYPNYNQDQQNRNNSNRGNFPNYSNNNFNTNRNYNNNTNNQRYFNNNNNYNQNNNNHESNMSRRFVQSNTDGNVHQNSTDNGNTGRTRQVHFQQRDRSDDRGNSSSSTTSIVGGHLEDVSAGVDRQAIDTLSHFH